MKKHLFIGLLFCLTTLLQSKAFAAADLKDFEIMINGEIFTDGYISTTKFCLGNTIEFNAQNNSYDISYIDWDFGDGVVQKNGKPQTTHDYSVPGWYDITAKLYGFQTQTTGSEQHLGTIQFSFRVVRTDTIYEYEQVCLDDNYTGQVRNDTIWPTDIVDCSTITATVKIYGKKSVLRDTIKTTDYYYEPLNGITYPQDPNNPQDYNQTIELNLTELFGIKNASNCDSIIYRNIQIITCLDMQINNRPEEQHICQGEPLDIPYTFTKGIIGEAYFIVNNEKTAIIPNAGFISLPVESLAPGVYNARIIVEDNNCGKVLQFPLDLTVLFPSDIFQYKFNNVLAVYKNGYGGNTGYDFIAYQWYRNGLPIEGATESIYHTTEPYTLGDEYFVVLTDKYGLTLPSCPQTINSVPNFNTQQNTPKASKVVDHQQMYIVREGIRYTIYGQRIK